MNTHNREGGMFQLKELILQPVKTEDIRPEGWLKKQLEIQRDSLGGNLHKFWPDIKNSRWIGGDCEGWERVPYWLDGLIPLAYLTEDEELKKTAGQYIDAILKRQEDDGWICPCKAEERSRYDMWALLLILKVLVEYQEASGDERIEEAIYRALGSLSRHIDTFLLFDWAAARWYEGLISVYWLYERRPERWIYDLAVKLRVQGMDYQQLIKHWPYTGKTKRGNWSQMSHVVNYAMAVKSLPLYSRVSYLAEDLNFAEEMVEQLFRYHGTASGVFTGDECLAGQEPIQGTELCSVVEFMYSLEQLLQLTGEPKWADMLEYTAFNALPATFSEDMWTHQYDQLVNQAECSVLEKEQIHFTTNDGESHIFGLEPNYGCCTANFGQGWPKFARSAFMKTRKGIASVLLVPSQVKTEIQGSEVTVTLKTEYPFQDSLRYDIRVSSPVKFELKIRIPAFAVNPAVNGETVLAGGFYTIEKEFQGEETIEVSIPSEPEFIKRSGEMVALRKGMLLYSIPVDSEWRKLANRDRGYENPVNDYEILPLSSWNYGFASREVEFEYHGIGEFPFSEKNPPVTGLIECVKIDWPKVYGKVTAVPNSRVPLSEKEKIKLIPFGCSVLRMTEVPML